jgi:hypothetical protein
VFSHRAKIMSENRVTNWSIATGAWKDGLSAIGAMRGVAVTALLALTLINLVPHLWTHGLDAVLRTGIAPGQAVLNASILLGLTVIEALLLTPLSIAVHRYVLLGERTSFYRLEIGLPRFRRFAFYTFVLRLISLVPTGLMLGFATVVKMVPPATIVQLAIGLVLLAISGSIVAAMLLVRLTLLFPAVAIDIPGAGWNRSLDQSRGHAWRIFFVLVLTTLIGLLAIPVAAVIQGVAAYLMLRGQAAVGAVLISVARAGVGVLIATALVAAASRLFRVLAAPAAPPLGAPAE